MIARLVRPRLRQHLRSVQLSHSDEAMTQSSQLKDGPSHTGAFWGNTQRTRLFEPEPFVVINESLDLDADGARRDNHIWEEPLLRVMTYRMERDKGSGSYCSLASEEFGLSFSTHVNFSIASSNAGAPH